KEDMSPQQWSTMTIRDAVRSSASAPLIFPATDTQTTLSKGQKDTHTLIDGGFFAGEILHDAYKKAKQLAPPDAEIVFVHLGTGRPVFNKTAEDFNNTVFKTRVAEMVSM